LNDIFAIHDMNWASLAPQQI